MGDWPTQWDKACKELQEAEAQYEHAETILARANARLTRAQEAANRLFHERVRTVNAADPELAKG